MTSKLRKLFAILTVFALLFCQFPGSVTGAGEWAAAEEAGTGESDPVGAPTVLLGASEDGEEQKTEKKLEYLRMHIAGRDSMTMQQALGSKYREKLEFDYPDPESMELSDDFQTVSGLKAVPYSKSGGVWVWDNDPDYWYWGFHVELVQDYVYYVYETGTVSLKDVLASFGAAYRTTYRAEQAGAYNSKVDYSNGSFTIQAADLPASGIVFDMIDTGSDTYLPYGILFLPGEARPETADHDDGIFTYRITDTSAEVTGFSPDFAGMENLTVPASFELAGKTITVDSVAEGAFMNNGLIRNLTFAGDILVGAYAFKDCDNMETLTFEGNAVIRSHAFEQCEEWSPNTMQGVTSIEFKGEKADIGGFAFKHCHRLTTLKTDNAIVSIGEQAFNSDAALNGELKGITKIGAYAFYGAPISSVTVSDISAVQRISGSAFGSPVALTINGSDLTINHGYLSYANSYSSITINADHLTFGSWALQHLGANVKKVTVNCENPITLSTEVFGDAWRGDLTFDINAPVTDVKYRAFIRLGKNQTGRYVINFNKGVDRIAGGAFEEAGFGSSTVVNIADNGGTTTVEDGAFLASDCLTVNFDMYKADVNGAVRLDWLTGTTVNYKPKHVDPADYRAEGKNQILLSALAQAIGIWNPETEAALEMTDVASVTFPEEDETTVQEVSGPILYNRTAEEDLAEGNDVGAKDFVLTRDGIFNKITRMTITTVEGTVIEVNKPYTAQTNPFSLKDAFAEAGIHFTGISSIAVASNPYGFLSAEQSEDFYQAGLGYTDANVTIQQPLPDGQVVMVVYGTFWDGSRQKAVTILQGEEIAFEPDLVDENSIFRLKLNADDGTAVITGLADEYAGDGNITIPAQVTCEGASCQVTAIDSFAFRKESRLKTVTFGNGGSVIRVGNFAFDSCPNLTSVGGSGNITFVQEPFTENPVLTTLNVTPADGNGAILASNNPELTEVTVNGGVIETLPSNYLYDNDKLAVVSFPAGVKAISADAFAGCEALTEVNLGTNGKNAGFALTIAEDAFKDNTALTTKVKVAQTVTSAAGTVELPKNTNAGLPLGTRLVVNNRDENEAIQAAAANAYSRAKQSWRIEYYDLSLAAPDGSAVTSGATVTLPMDVEWTGSSRVTKPNAKAFHATGETATTLGSVTTNDVAADGKLTFIRFYTSGFSPFAVGYEIDDRYHDDMFWYVLVKDEDGKVTEAQIDGVYDGYTGETLEISSRTRDENKYPVKRILANAFKNNKTITTVTGDATLTGFEIGESAFYGMTKLQTVTFGDDSLYYNFGEGITIKANAFGSCQALTSFTYRYNNAKFERNAFYYCRNLTTVVITGRGSLNIQAGAFSSSSNIRYLRVDNPCDMEDGAFSVSNGEAFVQNNDAPLNYVPAKKMGTFKTYVFAGMPWYVGNNLTGSVAKTVYFAKNTLPGENAFVSMIKYAGANLTDVYMDFDREEVSFADRLDEANPNVKIHWHENDKVYGFMLDGVAGDDETADGSPEHPYRTFAGLAEDWSSLTVDEDTSEPVEDSAIAETVNAALAGTGVNKTAGTFIDNIYHKKVAYICNTVTVSGEETWNYDGEDELVLYRDSEFKGAMVNVTGSLTLQRVVLDGNKAETGANASIINVRPGAVLNIQTGAEIRNNSFPQAGWDGSAGLWLNGGGVFADHATVNMSGGTISGNIAMYGGGIEMIGGTLNMSGGSIEGNAAVATTYINNLKVNGNGGGVLMMQGAVMNLSGGRVTGNRAEGQTASGIGVNGSTGAGIQLGAAYNDLYANCTLNMTGGEVSDNSAYAQGGGIFINASCVATVTGGEITGNSSGRGEFGGGGFYVNGARNGTPVNGLLNLYNVLITDNDAYYGGGIANCETVNLSIHMGSGSAIYGNDGGDLYLFLRQTGVGTKASISNVMMNGSAYNWTYEDGTPVQPELLAYFDAGRWDETTMISHPDSTDVSGQVKVRITGNHAGTKGGGIGSNGNVVIGDVPPSNEVIWTPEISKVVWGRDLAEGEEITFTVYEEHWIGGDAYNNQAYGPDTIAGTGKVTGAKDGVPQKIEFTPISLGVKGPGDVGKVAGRFNVIEDPNPDLELQTDEQSYYYFEVRVGTQVVDGEERYVGSAAVIKKGTYTRGEDGEIIYDYDSYNARDREWVRGYYEEKYLSLSPIVNRVVKRDVSIGKAWVNADGETADPPKGAKITLELYADGEPTGKTIELDGTVDELGEAEAWKAVWKDVDIYRLNEEGEMFRLNEDDADFARVEYAVKETAAEPAFLEIAEEPVPITEEEAVIVNTVPEEEPTPEPTPSPTPAATPTPTPVPVTEATVRKVWVEGNNGAANRPQNLTVTLSNGMQVTLNAANGWTATITDLPAVDENGQPITYTWREQEAIGYRQTGMTREGTVTTFTNTLWERPATPPANAGNPPVPGQTWLTVEEYDTPLGVEVIINHVGDCFD